MRGWGFTNTRGVVSPEIVAGRAPNASDEVALGTATMRALHKHIGDTVQAESAGKQSFDYRIAGRAAFRRLSNDYIEPLADGAAFTGEGLARIYNSLDSTRYLVGRLESGADDAVTLKAVSAMPAFAAPRASFTTDTGATGPAPPPEINRLRLIRWFPPSLALLLAVLGLVAVGHALVVAVHRRRRELGVLKTLGFERGQVRATVAWQATTLAAIGLVIGVSAGLVAGHLAWQHVADAIGVSPASPFPVLALAITIPVTLVAVNLLAALPARAAARTRPAMALQAE
jgi:putative ABC transport system permease protein